MDFKITKFLGSGLTLSKVKTTLDEGANKKTAQDLKQLLNNQTLAVSSTPDSNGIATARNVEQVAAKSAGAADAIRKVRERQLELATEAALTSDPQRQSSFDSEISSLDTEITRIANAATFNGQSVLNGQTVVIEDDSLEIHTAVSVPNLSSLTTDPGVSVTNQTSAIAAVTTLTAVLGAARDGEDAAEVSLSRATQSEDFGIVKTVLGPEGDPRVRDINQAQVLADKIAGEIRENYPPKSREADIVVSNLDPDRVAELLA